MGIWAKGLFESKELFDEEELEDVLLGGLM